MGRPRASDLGPVPTKERILQRALELFAERGFDAVSVRQIVGSLGLTEATLYAHYRSKRAVFDAILERLETRLISPAFAPPSPDEFRSGARIDIASYLLEGAKRFYARADRETMLTWRLLMVSQYHLPAARTGVERHLLAAPGRFFTTMVERMQEAGAARADADARAAGRVLAAVFFQRSFEANLEAAWEGETSDFFESLRADLELVCRSLGASAR